MSDKIRFRMIGGFLGAGKTTTISQLARRYQQEGLNVGIVTNDQAAGLVDTQLLQSQGFQVGEVAGACFCCSFNNLTETIEQLETSQRPDIVLAEPVGSCTDLVATVAQPLMQMFGGGISVGPYTVILKPSHGQKILRGSGQRGFSPQAEYIFRKQLEEADLLLVNRIDELTEVERQELLELLNQDFPNRDVLCISAKTGEGIEQLQQRLETPGIYCRRILDIDYDVYAEGEAELGWLNANVRAAGTAPFELDELIVGVVERIVAKVRAAGSEVAHLKVIGQTEGAYAVANAISSERPTQLSLAADYATSNAELVINARIATSPEALQAAVEAVLRELVQDKGLSLTVTALNCLSPGRPVPTHRVSSVD